MRPIPRLLVGLVLGTVLGGGSARAQGAGECTSVDCGPRSAQTPLAPSPSAMQQVWQAAGALHEGKLQLIATIQRVTQAQAGLFGDERPQLESAIAAMRRALEAWDEGVVRFMAGTSRVTVSAELHVARGTVLLDRHRMIEALKELDEAARMEPDRPDVPALQALALAAQGRSADALRALGRATART